MPERASAPLSGSTPDDYDRRMRQGEVTDIRVGQVQGRAYGPQGHRSGPTFVLLPGIGMSHRYFRSLRVALETEGETVALDLPGFGATPDPGRGLSVPEYAQFTGEMLDALGIPPLAAAHHEVDDGVKLGLDIVRKWLEAVPDSQRQARVQELTRWIVLGDHDA